MTPMCNVSQVRHTADFENSHTRAMVFSVDSEAAQRHRTTRPNAGVEKVVAKQQVSVTREAATRRNGTWGPLQASLGCAVRLGVTPPLPKP